jgi:hypothetical protein
VRSRHFCGSREEKAVRAILDESGALSAVQTAEDLSLISRKFVNVEAK